MDSSNNNQLVTTRWQFTWVENQKILKKFHSKESHFKTISWIIIIIKMALRLKENQSWHILSLWMQLSLNVMSWRIILAGVGKINGSLQWWASLMKIFTFWYKECLILTKIKERIQEAVDQIKQSVGSSRLAQISIRSIH